MSQYAIFVVLSSLGEPDESRIRVRFAESVEADSAEDALRKLRGYHSHKKLDTPENSDGDFYRVSCRIRGVLHTQNVKLVKDDV